MQVAKSGGTGWLMIKVILCGSKGRMGRVLTTAIEPLQDMLVVAGIDRDTETVGYPVFGNLADCDVPADVLIDFSHAAMLPRYLPEAARRGLPVVIATTGLSPEDMAFVSEAATKIPIFNSANMSIGINLLQTLVKDATKALGERYDVEIVEKHHKLKKDAPSGTALMLADSINEVRINKLRYVAGREGRDSLRADDELGIHAVRGGTLVGEHDVYFTGLDELVQIGHKAYSRQVFASGAIAAARYLLRRKPGKYSMQDVLNEASAITTVYTYPGEAVVTLDEFPNSMEAIAELYGRFASADVFIDMISHSGSPGEPLSLSFTVNSRDVGRTRELLSELSRTYPTPKSSIVDNTTKITVEGPGMEFQSGVAWRLFACMARLGVHVYAVTTSEIKISYIVANDEVDTAVEGIRAEFGV
ncbi:MAG: 4-hydroxy-tetrahydrodipicolinate reductase, partial [Spirochaetales bacterium]|nr:4-hydroxy-tetrahydrodipicolinate reductase [Spirochaetales bacterium]